MKFYYEFYKIIDQNSNFPINILTGNKEDKILKQISVVANLVCEEIEFKVRFFFDQYKLICTVQIYSTFEGVCVNVCLRTVVWE